MSPEGHDALDRLGTDIEHCKVEACLGNLRSHRFTHVAEPDEAYPQHRPASISLPAPCLIAKARIAAACENFASTRVRRDGN
jgi:hypothetical protein